MYQHWVSIVVPIGLKVTPPPLRQHFRADGVTSYATGTNESLPWVNIFGAMGLQIILLVEHFRVNGTTSYPN